MSEDLIIKPEPLVVATPRQNTGWYTTTLHSKMHMHSNGGWVDIPNGWTTDAPGIVSVRADGWDTGVDLELYVDGLNVADVHNENFRGSALQMLCPQGVWVSWGLSGGNIVHFKYMRIHY